MLWFSLCYMLSSFDVGIMLVLLKKDFSPFFLFKVMLNP